MSIELSIVAVGKLQQKYAIEGCRLYEERLKHYLKLKLIEVADVKGHYSDQEKARIECERMDKILSTLDVVVLLDEHGKRQSSTQLASAIESFQQRNQRKIGLVLGGANGFTAEFKLRYPNHWTLSDFTLPHEMARLVMTEQVYRAMTILKNESYHKAGLTG
ncbi:MAG: 23S rRNA (pseudouridine(1915)-N(3))-methyltransferase RlmH [Bacteroidetes bacterium]|nr:23S rRNA (pseudouridine(1915)-N(3))-methyltransferase RlmH [Bacteroidota bacterium]